MAEKSCHGGLTIGISSHKEETYEHTKGFRIQFVLYLIPSADSISIDHSELEYV
jgi:hypothetical protein